ncbi:hypothetical protein AB0E85_13905 [Streptomyces sp. NPDC029044]|uniref:hypothetical protein n=1 Tax=Streptomyces sp. NPDC029044 TaxID=3157198 RepID=UPI0033D043F8
MAEQTSWHRPGPDSPAPDGRLCWWAALTSLPLDVLPGLAGCEDDPAERHIVRSVD